MPLNTIYRSTTGIIGNNTRYYIEIIPRSTTLYSSPTTVEFPLAAIQKDWQIEAVMNDDKIGLKRPDGYSINIDLEMLSEDLREYLLDPFINHDMASEFPYKATTRVDVPNFDLTNVWIIKTDEGDDELDEDDFLIYNTFGVKKNPSRIHQITKDGDIQKHKLDIVLHDLFRVITEAIHPIYLTWCAYEDAQNNTFTTIKEVERVYDIAYSTQTAKSDYYTVKVYVESATDTLPASTTVDSVSLSIGDKVLFSHTGDEFVYVLELVDDGPVEYEIIRKTGPFGDILSGEIFYVESGTHTDKNFGIYYYVPPLGIGLKARYNTIEVTVETGNTKVIAKVEGNFNSAIAHFAENVSLREYTDYCFDFFYKRLMRVAQSDTDYVLVHSSTSQNLSSYKLYKQSYDIDYTKGDVLNNATGVYYCSLIESNGVIIGGYLAENDSNEGIYEYENLWDMFENSKGQALIVSYAHYDKAIRLIHDPIEGVIVSSLVLDIEDLKFGDGATYEIEENPESKRGVIVNIDVPGDNKNEHKSIITGSISDEELSIKSMFHNNPSINLATDGWIETQSYPELKSSLQRLVVKQNNPEMPFDSRKLVYFDTPTDIADSEMCIRLHSACSVKINDIQYDYYDMPFDKLPSNNDPWNELKIVFIDLQNYTGMPYATAKQLSIYFSKQNRFLLKATVEADKVFNMPAGQGITADISDRFLNGDEPNVNQNWLLRSNKIKGDNQNAEIELIGLY